MTALVWYRNDLRVAWHSPLAAASRSGLPVRALYLLCEKQWDTHEVASLRRWYVLASLQELGEQLARKGIVLDIIDAGDFSSVPACLADYVRRHGITQLYCNREYPVNEIRRDREVAERLREHQVAIFGSDDGVLVPPRALKTGHGNWYTVFTPYRRQWQVYLDAQPPQRTSVRSQGEALAFSSPVLEQALHRCAVPAALRQQWQPGETAARRQLQVFCDRALAHYKRDRDFPAQAGTSQLSVALSAGTLSAAECYSRASERMHEPSVREGVGTWIGELAWRDFYRQIMANFPKVCRGEPFRPETGFIQWQRDEQLFAAWCEGRTGYPLVDAAMRQLRDTGWMHNRLRMVVAMFLTKQLFIDWRWGERFFMQHLIDGDFAANNGGWQWSASTGTDAAPYFRVFNPVRQSQRFDPEGEFIRRWIPALRDLDNKGIHEPWRQPLLAPDYPAPVVSLGGVKENVTRAFRAAQEIYQAGGQ